MNSDSAAKRLGQTVVLLPATRRDGMVSADLFARAGIACVVAADIAEAVDRLNQHIGALVTTESVFQAREIASLTQALAQQPPWSDTPVVMMSRADDPAVLRAIAKLSNVTLLERPTSVKTLIAAVQAALRARARQFQIRDQLEALRQADEALRLADRRKDEFLATLAHELRNPLAPLRSALQLLERETTQTGQTPPLLAVMDRQMTVMVRLIDDLLDVARISSGKVVLQRERLDFRLVIELAIEAARPNLESAGHALMVRLPEHAVWISGDATRLAQVVGNLLNNAAKYTPNGGRVEVEVSDDAGMATLRVADNGVGIPTELLPKVFDMFAQVNRTLDRSQGGLGIGLALVRRLVEMHAGTITANSGGQDAGSTFTMTLPLIEAPLDDGATRASVSQSPRVGALGARILIVDDNRDAADVLALLLASEGYETRTEYSGPAAIAAASEFRPRVVFCDIGMPGMSGHEVAQRLRADRDQAATVLIALTGWGTADDKRQSREAGFDFHLTKPVHADALSELLNRI